MSDRYFKRGYNLVEYVITKYRDLTVMAIVSDGRVEDLIADEGKKKLNVGDIVIAKVTDITANISSAFLELGESKAYMTLSGDDRVRPGDELPVQILKEACGNKEMTVTKKLSIPGKYAVVSLASDGTPRLHISRKLTDTSVRTRLQDEISPMLDQYDITLRTNAAGGAKEDISAEIHEISGVLSDILERAATRTVFSRLYESTGLFTAAIRDSRYAGDKVIVTDQPDIMQDMSEAFPDIKIRLYQDDSLPLSVVYKIGYNIESIRDRRVWLKSGAYLIIDRTEAMTVIDVNSGKTDIKGSREDTFFAINKEAAKEIARQLRIRNISGMILVDFINMKKHDNYEALRICIEKETACDLSGTIFVDFTKLGIAELTRKKTRCPIHELL